MPFSAYPAKRIMYSLCHQISTLCCTQHFQFPVYFITFFSLLYFFLLPEANIYNIICLRNIFLKITHSIYHPPPPLSLTLSTIIFMLFPCLCQIYCMYIIYMYSILYIQSDIHTAAQQHSNSERYTHSSYPMYYVQ